MWEAVACPTEPMVRMVACGSHSQGRAGSPRPGASSVRLSSVPGVCLCCWACVCLAGASAALVLLPCRAQRRLQNLRVSELNHGVFSPFKKKQYSFIGNEFSVLLLEYSEE